MTSRQEQSAFEAIWDELTAEPEVRPSAFPKGFVLGGQPGAGKSNLIHRINAEMNGNLMIINGDEFRRYHPDFDAIQAQYGKDAPKHTAEFSAKMTGLVLERALNEQYNVSIEGTFRTAEVPMATLDKMHEHGYQTAVHIQTAPTEISWQSTLERYDDMLRVGETPRYTDKAHHDLVVDSLPGNADAVFESGKADSFKVYSREGLIFDDRIHLGSAPGVAIDVELHRNSRLLDGLEKEYQEKHHLLSDIQKLVVNESEKIIKDLPPAEQVQAKIYLYSGQLTQLQQTQSTEQRPSEHAPDVEIDR